ncbi:hypothetical protein HPB52_001013 [Rhipicephalus sanguineus]|uniref:Uncharacterized protein n=1 Tax=Rhipicephalus sanguineus TaxID=34632 RepID=A0A9D4PCE3_RHISA|nr:hypothetical protein HPB52_001013 [Rhipicephalus sanguineus]
MITPKRKTERVPVPSERQRADFRRRRPAETNRGLSTTLARFRRRPRCPRTRTAWKTRRVEEQAAATEVDAPSTVEDREEPSKSDAAWCPKRPRLRSISVVARASKRSTGSTPLAATLMQVRRWSRAAVVALGSGTRPMKTRGVRMVKVSAVPCPVRLQMPRQSGPPVWYDRGVAAESMAVRC